MGDLDKAVLIAVKAHLGQVDKAGEPYIAHCISVMNRVSGYTNSIVAILHDVIEDTKLTFEDLLKEGMSLIIIEALNCLTRRKGESYRDYIERIKKNRIAVEVKIADLKHNSDINRIPNPTDKDYERLDKYNQYIRELTKFYIGDK